MAFQLGRVGAIGPMVGDTFAIHAAAVGLLVGLYLSPGFFPRFPAARSGGNSATGAWFSRVWR